jgi:hypothetical protein
MNHRNIYALAIMSPKWTPLLRKLTPLCFPQAKLKIDAWVLELHKKAKKFLLTGPGTPES